MEKELIYRKALELWGFKNQCLMLVEECSELQTATLHLFRNSKNKNKDEADKNFNNYINEMVDVEIVLECLKDNLCEYDKNIFIERKKNRLERLETFIKGDINNGI